MFPYDVLRFWPQKQLRKFFAPIFMLFSLFLCGLFVSEKERFVQDSKENNASYLGTKAKPRTLHQSDLLRETSEIFYLDSEPQNVVADDQLQVVTSRPAKRLPSVLVIGVKKSGTRALMEFLRFHPDVCAPANEIHYFSKNYYKGLDWYRWVIF